jgi:hypothetical protein
VAESIAETAEQVKHSRYTVAVSAALGESSLNTSNRFIFWSEPCPLFALERRVALFDW